MQGPLHRPAVFVFLALGFGAAAGCSRPLGIVQKASDGAEALTNRAEETFKDVSGKVDAFNDRLKEKVKDLGDDLTTWKDEDEDVITPTSSVRVDQRPIVRSWPLPGRQRCGAPSTGLKTTFQSRAMSTTTQPRCGAASSAVTSLPMPFGAAS